MTYRYKSQVEEEAEAICAELDVGMAEDAVRFPADSWEYAGEARDILIVDAAKVKGLGAAIAYRARDYFTVSLLRRLGFISGKEAIGKLMAGVNSNLLASFDPENLPYKAQGLIQKTGCGVYLLSGFVISPK